MEPKFKPFFDEPEIPPNVVLDFETSETSEGRLLHTLMSLSHSDERRGVSALGHKEWAESERQPRCGHCDATDGKFIDEVKRCIENLGGKTEEANTVDQAVKVASRWLCDKFVLFVCDDL
eukprot:IDg22366t1